MALPIYFKQFPQLSYLTSINNAGVGKFTQCLNFFNRTRMSDTVFKYATFYYNYEIQEGETPEDVAKKAYGDDGLYWIILQVNDIVDVYSQWPLSSSQMDEYLLKKYGSWENAGQISHYETVETKNATGDIVLPGGLVVGQDFIFRYFPDPNNKTENEDGEFVKLSSLPISVSFEEVERRQNERKKSINILSPKYINEYIRLTRLELNNSPEKSSELDLSKFLQ